MAKLILCFLASLAICTAGCRGIATQLNMRTNGTAQSRDTIGNVKVNRFLSPEKNVAITSENRELYDIYSNAIDSKSEDERYRILKKAIKESVVESFKSKVLSMDPFVIQKDINHKVSRIYKINKRFKRHHD